LKQDNYFTFIIRAIRWLVVSIGLVIALLLLLVVILYSPQLFFKTETVASNKPQLLVVKSKLDLWKAPDASAIPSSEEGEKIKYGKELIAHTAKYLGPEGSVKQISNGMNCQNCHLDAGTKPFGNNYGSVASTYPKLRARSGSMESIEKRVNDCFERSLNGAPLDSASTEMRAIVAYIQWLGKDVPKGEQAKGAGLKEIALLDRAADPIKGKMLYQAQCEVCHGSNGGGKKEAGSSEYQFPPLWGNNSYNDGAGLFRVTNFARYVYANMPLGATHDNPILTEEEAWDIAAYVNSLQRPHKDTPTDWPILNTKPVDHPFGPYADPFTQAQHKYGPYQPIKNFYKKN